MHFTRCALPALLILLATAAPDASGQAPTAPVARERRHPELVDTTWGPRARAAWDLALARHYSDARQRFELLHREQPDAVDPQLGLAFVARGEGRISDARRWLREAYTAESTADIAAQLEAAEWDRPGALELLGGATHAGGRTTSDWSVGAVVPVDPRVALTGRAGAIGGGDPLRGIFLDSIGAAQARMVSGGVVVRPIDGTTLTGRFERWTSTGRSQNFLFLDLAQRLGSVVTAHVGARPQSGSFGSPQVSGGLDFLVAPGQVATIEASQGIRGTPFEARTQVRAFYLFAPSVRASMRLGVIRDVDPSISATAGVASGSVFINPHTGIRLELLARRGSFERSSADAGFVLRW